jgi:hypothetical protein
MSRTDVLLPFRLTSRPVVDVWLSSYFRCTSCGIGGASVDQSGLDGDGCVRNERLNQWTVGGALAFGLHLTDCASLMLFSAREVILRQFCVVTLFQCRLAVGNALQVEPRWGKVKIKARRYFT